MLWCWLEGEGSKDLLGHPENVYPQTSRVIALEETNLPYTLEKLYLYNACLQNGQLFFMFFWAGPLGKTDNHGASNLPGT